MRSAVASLRIVLPAIAAVQLAGCNPVQSALAPQSYDTARIEVLFWILTIGSCLIMGAVIALAAIAMLGGERWKAWLANETLVVGAGLVFPVVVLTALLAYGLTLMASAGDPAQATSALRIKVEGRQWWWRVIYNDQNGQQIESANEIRIPVGQVAKLELTTSDVIHSLWVPRLAGKLDMIPGRRNVLTLAAKEPGMSRGQCAEYCGGAHALMSLYVVALPEKEFDAWLAHEATPAAPVTDPDARAGQMLFLSHGCGGCHTIRGTAAVGTIGPDLTHVGSRMSLGAAALPNDQSSFARWIRDNQHIKPQNFMPPFAIFSDKELAVLSLYLSNLK